MRSHWPSIDEMWQKCVDGPEARREVCHNDS